MKTIAIMFVALAAFAMYASASKVDSTKLWRQYRSELFNFLRQGDSEAMPGLQLVASPIPAEWDTNPEALQMIANGIPKVGASWELRTTKLFTREYHRFLTNLEIPTQSSEFDQELLDLEDSLFDKQMDVEDAEWACEGRYDTYQNRGRRKRVYSWEQFKQKLCPRIQTLEERVIIVRGQIEAKKARAGGAMFDAAMALGRYASTPAAERVFKALGSLQRFADAAAADKTNSFSVKIQHKTAISETKTGTMGLSFGISVPITAGISLGVNGNYEKTSMNFKSNSEELQISFGAGGWKAIPIWPSKTWCDMSVLSQYKNGPFRQKGIKYFGLTEAAKLPWVPKTIFVVVKPEVDMYVTSEDKEAMESSSSFGVGVTVGPLEFNFNKGSTKNFEHEVGKLYKVELKGNSPVPQLLAIDNQILGDSF